MVLWEIRSYPDALARERDRILARTRLQDTYGRIAWRWKAPRRERALYRLGELAPDALTEAVTALDTGGTATEAGAARPVRKRRTAKRRGRRKLLADYVAEARQAWRPGIDITPAWVRSVTDCARGTSKAVADALRAEQAPQAGRGSA
jgi:hypothetical protein